MANLIAVPIPVTTTGSNGSASGSVIKTSLSGKLHHIAVVPHASAPGTTKVDVDLVLNDDTTSLLKILNLTATASPSFKSPRLPVQTTAGADVTLSGTTIISELIVLAGMSIKVAVTLSNALTPAATVFLILEQ